MSTYALLRIPLNKLIHSKRFHKAALSKLKWYSVLCGSFQNFLNIILQNQGSSLVSWSRHFEYFNFAFRSWWTHSECMRHIRSRTHELCVDNPAPFSFVVYQLIINYHRIFNTSIAHNSTSRGRSVYLPEHLMLLLILVMKVLLMYCSHEPDERYKISIYQMAINLLFLM